MSTPNRRQFIQASAASAAIATTTKTATAKAPVHLPAEKIRIGFIGPGGRGFNAHVKTLTKLAKEGQPIELVAVCDVYSRNMDQAAKHIEKNLKKAPAKYVDYREMLEKEDLDAVCILSLIHI